MAGRNIKIELELPEFEKELNITVTLQRDGEVLNCSTSSSSGAKQTPNDNYQATFKQDVKTEMENTGNGWKQIPDPTPVSSSGSSFSGGNMMNINF